MIPPCIVSRVTTGNLLRPDYCELVSMIFLFLLFFCKDKLTVALLCDNTCMWLFFHSVANESGTTQIHG
jgi:hypothetical protein